MNITYPDKLVSEKELMQLYAESWPKYKDKRTSKGNPLPKTRTPRATNALIAPFSRVTPDAYYVAMDGDILAGWTGWKKLEGNLYMTTGSATIRDYMNKGIQKVLFDKRDAVFGNSGVIVTVNNPAEGWSDFVSRFYPLAKIQDIPEKYREALQESIDFYTEKGSVPKIYYRGPTEDNAMEKAWGIIKMR